MPYKPPPPKPKANKLLQWAPIILTVLGGIYFLSSDYVGLLMDKRIDNKLQLSVEKSDAKVQSITNTLETLGRQVVGMEVKLDILMLQKLAMQPKKSVNAKQTSDILSTAKKNGTKLDADLIIDAGKQFISAGISSSDPSVWNAAQTFLDYRSYLNIALAPVTDNFAPIDKEKPPWKFQWNLGPVKAGDKFRIKTGKKAPAENAAVFEPIGSPLNVGEKFGMEFVLFEDVSAGFSLDGMRLKNIILKNSKIIYAGGPVEMENVYFVNCTFEVSKRPNGQSFANTVLASSPATTFHTRG